MAPECNIHPAVLLSYGRSRIRVRLGRLMMNVRGWTCEDWMMGCTSSRTRIVRGLRIVDRMPMMFSGVYDGGRCDGFDAVCNSSSVVKKKQV